MKTIVLARCDVDLWGAASPVQAKLVACVGDSITYGSGIANPAQDSYPSQLQRNLQRYDPAWKVQNFGVSGATLLTKGDLPYVNQTAYSRRNVQPRYRGHYAGDQRLQAAELAI